MTTAGQDLDVIQRTLNDSGELWPREDLLLWYRDAYVQFLSQTGMVRRWTVLDVPGRTAYATTQEWEDRFTTGTTRALGLPTGAGQYRVTATWEVERLAGQVTTNARQMVTHLWEMLRSGVVDDHFRFHLPKSNEQIVHVTYDDEALDAIGVRELDGGDREWMRNAGEAVFWTLGLGRVRTFEVFEVENTDGQAYAPMFPGNGFGIPRLLSGSRTYATTPETQEHSSWAYTTEGDRLAMGRGRSRFLPEFVATSEGDSRASTTIGTLNVLVRGFDSVVQGTQKWESYNFIPPFTSAEAHANFSTWATQVSAADNQWFGIVWADALGLFVAVSFDGVGNRVMTSYDGEAWITQSSAADNQWASIAWSPRLRLLVAVAASGTGDRVMTSPDGVTWTTQTSAADNEWASVVWSPERRLLVAVATTGTGDRVMTSPDGETWTAQTSPADNPWRNVTWASGLGLFVAVALDGDDRVMTSPDGVVWTLQTAAASVAWRDVAWSPELGLLVAISSETPSNRVMTSSDGVTWTSAFSGIENEWHKIVWSPELGVFVAVAATGTGDRVMTSPNGVTWTSRASGADIGWRNVAWSPQRGQLVAVAITGVGNRVMATTLAAVGTIRHFWLWEAQHANALGTPEGPVESTQPAGQNVLRGTSARAAINVKDDLHSEIEAMNIMFGWEAEFVSSDATLLVTLTASHPSPVGTASFEAKFASRLGGTFESFSRVGDYPVGVIRSVESPDRQYLPRIPDTGVTRFLGGPRVWASTVLNVGVLEALAPRFEFREDETPPLIPAQAQKHLRWYVLWKAFGQSGEGRRVADANHYLQLFNRAIQTFRKLGSLTRSDLIYLKEVIDVPIETRPARPRLPSAYPALRHF